MKDLTATERYARDELFSLLDANPETFEALLLAVKDNRINGGSYWVEDCGCIYGTVAAALFPSEKKTKAQAVALRLREEVTGRSAEAYTSPLEEVALSLRPIDPDHNPLALPFPAQEQARDLLLSWLEEWKRIPKGART